VFVTNVSKILVFCKNITYVIEVCQVRECGEIFAPFMLIAYALPPNRCVKAAQGGESGQSHTKKHIAA
jgi:hypothetical protein